MPKLLKFYCPKCHGEELEVVQVNAVVSQRVQVNADNGDVYYTATPEIAGEDCYVDHWQCAKCGYEIPCGNDDESLADWLRQEPYNLPIERSLEEQKQIKAAVSALLNASRAYVAAYAEVVADGSLNNIVSPERLEFRRKLKELYELIGGCDDIIKTAVGSDDVQVGV